MKRNIQLFFFIFLSMGCCYGGKAFAEVVDRVVAIVNEDIVTQVDIEREAAPYLKKILSSGYSQEKQEELIKKVNEDLLEALIEQSLTQQEARRYGISISEDEIDNAVESVKGRRSLTQEEFEKALSYEGMTIEAYRENIKKQLLHARIINVAVKSKVVITDTDIQTYYNNHIAEYAGKKKHHLRNILMRDREEIGEIKRRLDENQSFVILAKQFSMAPNASEGGDLGLFDVSNFTPQIRESISKLEKGEYTDIIQTAQGFQIFFIEDIVLDGNRTLEQVADEIEGILYQEEVEKKFQSWLETLKKNAHIKRML
ncbi:MAG: SurA N-terminal domain-containing protein [Desulfobacterales bacterium]|nr:SurA N-terminal domain-containing protein [Desulfobacterales bacterium]